MSTGKIELSVGAVKIADKYEMFTEEEINNINKIPELDERVDIIEDEMEESVKFEIVGEGATVPPISGGGSDYDDREIREMIDEINVSLDDMVSYPVLYGEIGVVNVNYDYGNVKRYGAIGDISNEDNTIPFQNAIDNAYMFGFTVFIPMGIYNIKNSLVLPNKVSFKGEQTTRYVYDYVYTPNEYKGSLIISKCDYLFIPNKKDEDNMQITTGIFKDIMFLCRTTGSLDKSVLFKNFLFTSSVFDGVGVLDYSIVFYGYIKGVTNITNCVFQGIRTGFIYSIKGDVNGLIDDLLTTDNQCLIDSYIEKCYINGKARSTGVTLFNGNGISHSTITNNFIDYAKRVFYFKSSSKPSIISNNTFDVCYRVFTGIITELNITSNNFTNCTYNVDYWGALTDEEMLNNEWTVFTPKSGFTDCNISNNNVYKSDRFFASEGSFYNVFNLTFNNNMITSYKSENPFKYECIKSNNELDQKNIFIGDLMYKEYENLPNPSLSITGGIYRITTFNGQIIRYKNKMIYNNNGVWTNFDGSEFTE